MHTNDQKNNTIILQNTGDLKAYKNHSNIITNVEITEKKYKTNIVISKKLENSESWIIATNNTPTMLTYGQFFILNYIVVIYHYI